MITISFFAKERQQLAAEVARLQADLVRLNNILIERDRLITELRQALDAPRRMPFLSVGGESGNGDTEYERSSPEWL